LRYHQRGKSSTSGLGSIRPQTATGCSIPGHAVRRGGRLRDVNVREVLNAIFYVLSTGCQWKALPKSTAHHYFMLWDWDGSRIPILQRKCCA
jgi:Putative transposase of IS4/5 family (DUF4096)